MSGNHGSPANDADAYGTQNSNVGSNNNGTEHVGRPKRQCLRAGQREDSSGETEVFAPGGDGSSGNADQLDVTLTFVPIKWPLSPYHRGLADGDPCKFSILYIYIYKHCWIYNKS